MKKSHLIILAVLLQLFFISFSCFELKNLYAAETERLSIVTAGTGGVFYVYGGGIANVVSKYVPDLNLTAESTGGSVENMKILNHNQAAIALTSADVLYSAVVDFKNSKHFKEKVNVSALFNMYYQPHQFVSLKKTSVKNINDIRGKRIAVGSPGSGTEVKTKMILGALGITYKDFTPEFLSFTEGTEALQNNTVEGVFLGVSYPASAIVSLSLTNPIRMINFSDDEITKIVKRYPFLSKSIIPGKTYRGVDQDTQTLAVQALVVCRDDLSEKTAYNIVKTFFEHKNELDEIHNSFRETSLENAPSTIIPLHPGAIKYFKEMKVLE
ncbi:TAXI family TRAP transporter solute-binding subunit [Desulfocicer niacini]